jgi:hypothetical protein
MRSTGRLTLSAPHCPINGSSIFSDSAKLSSLPRAIRRGPRGRVEAEVIPVIGVDIDHV